MTKRILITLGVLIGIPVLYYLISPAFRVKEVNDQLPGNLTVEDNFGKMDAATEKKLSDDMTVANQNPPKAANDKMAAKSFAILATGDFQARAHNVKGAAALVQVGGQKILRFENFETINGPDLYVYLSSGLNSKDIVDLGRIRGTKGFINYNVPASVDTNKYRYVLVWCKPFGVLFSYAELR